MNEVDNFRWSPCICNKVSINIAFNSLCQIHCQSDAYHPLTKHLVVDRFGAMAHVVLGFRKTELVSIMDKHRKQIQGWEAAQMNPLTHVMVRNYFQNVQKVFFLNVLKVLNLNLCKSAWCFIYGFHQSRGNIGLHHYLSIVKLRNLLKLIERGCYAACD
ncbi:hypothetical protein DFH11DRAFT_1566223 [Phellopilus nigrolimitatus]|nr:hypothetical protein DFH11DRAFT_1566223 [Phellopilus nigrolimitatus]